MPSLSLSKEIHGKCLSLLELLIDHRMHVFSRLYVLAACILACAESFMQLLHNGFNLGLKFHVSLFRLAAAVGAGPANPSGGNFPIPNLPPWWVKKNSYMRCLFIIQM